MMPPAFPAPASGLDPTDQAQDAAQCPFSPDAGAQAKPIQSHSFRLTPVQDMAGEAAQFLRQMAQEMGTGDTLAARLAEVQASITACGTWQPSVDEATFGARVAWRNSVRCVGRMFWPSLKVFDARTARSYDGMIEALLAHIDWSTNGGDLRPALTLFAHDGPQMRIINSQLILYAGYALPDGRILGDPKNVDLTRLAMALGWQGKGEAFDVLPLILRIGDAPPRLFEIPPEKVLQVAITHPECTGVAGLGLRWFALPAVASMALDMGGLQFTAAPSSGVYQGSEIGSFNLADPRRYNVLPAMARALGLDTGPKNPLWRDQALVEVNRAVLHSFAGAGVRIMDHHSLSASFDKFCTREAAQGRKVYGDWGWITPPLSSNLSWIWHTKTFQKVILKPGYFYQDMPQNLAQLIGAAPNAG